MKLQDKPTTTTTRRSTPTASTPKQKVEVTPKPTATVKVDVPVKPTETVKSKSTRKSSSLYFDTHGNNKSLTFKYKENVYRVFWTHSTFKSKHPIDRKFKKGDDGRFTLIETFADLESTTCTLIKFPSYISTVDQLKKEVGGKENSDYVHVKAEDVVTVSVTKTQNVLDTPNRVQARWNSLVEACNKNSASIVQEGSKTLPITARQKRNIFAYVAGVIRVPGKIARKSVK